MLYVRAEENIIPILPGPVTKSLAFPLITFAGYQMEPRTAFVATAMRKESFILTLAIFAFSEYPPCNL